MKILMAYSESILGRAESMLRQAQQAHQRRQQSRRAEIYRSLPRTQEIEQELRQTAPRILSSALRQGVDSEIALATMKAKSTSLEKEKVHLLTKAGYPADALNETPYCPLCNDRGWNGSTMCQCLKDFCQKEQIAQISSLLNLGNQSFDTFRLDYYDRQVWPEFHRSPRENIEIILSTCRNYAELFSTFPKKNLYFFGAPGLGKTFLSACIAREVSEAGYSVVYDTAANIFSRFETKTFSHSYEQTRQAEADTRRYLICDLLILDDLGSEFTTLFTQSALYELINTRLVEDRHTIISSNLSPEKIRQRYSAQVHSRLIGTYLALPFFGQDIRYLKKMRG